MLPLLAALLLAAPAQLVLEPPTRLFLEGDSNVRRWSCDSSELRLTSFVETGTDGEAPAVRSLVFELEVASLRCGDEHMEAKLRESLKAEQFPVIRYRLGGARLVRTGPAGQHFILTRGTLTVAGVERQVDLLVLASASPRGDLRALGSLALRMSDFGVDPPSAFLGLVQSKDELLVRFDFRGRAAPLTD